MADSFDERFPHIADWVQGYGFIEIGRDDYSRSLVRALDPGGIVWEGKTKYASVEELLQELEKALAEFMETL
jgi:hypothetical protein